MTALPAPAQQTHGKTIFAALLLGILCSLCIYTYSTNNLEVLGLSPESQKARTLEIIVLLIGQTFLSFAIGKVYEHNPAWAYKLGFILVILFIVDFASSYQARNAINQHQTLTKSATEEHAKLIAAQIGVAQNTAKELTDSAQRQRNNKFITAGAVNANKAAKQADSATDLIRLHGETIKQIRPTEADTFGAWTGNIIFMSMLGLYLLNDAMWAFIGHFVGRGNQPAPVTAVTAPAAPPTAPAPAHHPEIRTPERTDFGTPQTAAQTTAPKVEIDIEKAKAAVKKQSAIDRMPKVMPWQFVVPAITIASGAKGMEAPKAPIMPTAKRTEIGTPSVPKSGHEKDNQKDSTKAKTKVGKQMDTGTQGKASHRYKRVKALVESRAVKPSINALARLAGEHISKDVATDYMNAMERDGIVKRHGKGWVLV